MKTSIIVASLGRCGSTLVYQSLFDHFIEGDFVRDLTEDNIPEGHVVKTHDFAPESLSPHCKVIFLFGDPRDIVISTNTGGRDGRVNIRQHYRNLHASIKDFPYSEERDVMRLEENFDSWYQPQSFPLLTLRYETLYDHLEVINAFVDRQVMIPPRKKRLSDWRTLCSPGFLSKSYGSLITKIDKADDVKLWI